MTNTIDSFQKILDRKYVNEDVAALSYAGCKNSTSIRCNKCGKIYTFIHAENAYSKNKKFICRKCADGVREEDFALKLQKKYPSDNLSVVSFNDRGECKIKCNTCGKIYEYKEPRCALEKNMETFCIKCFPRKKKERDKTKNKFIDFLNNNDNWTLCDNLDDKFSSDVIKCTCQKCGKVNYKTMRDYIRGRRCLCETHNNPKNDITFSEYLEDGYCLVGHYSGINKKVKIRHRCGFIYETVARNCCKNGGKCPKCNKKSSKGEKLISKYLEEKSIDYIREYPVEIDNRKLRIDFYIPEYDIFIEFQGIQHYEPVEFFGEIDKFNRQIENDSLKKEKLKNKLYAISYNDNVNQKMNDILKVQRLSTEVE